MIVHHFDRRSISVGTMNLCPPYLLTCQGSGSAVLNLGEVDAPRACEREATDTGLHLIELLEQALSRGRRSAALESLDKHHGIRIAFERPIITRSRQHV